MSHPTFAALWGESSVASAITLLVCAWFLVAAGTILADPEMPYAAHAARQAAPSPVAIAPEAHLTIVVEARRG